MYVVRVDMMYDIVRDMRANACVYVRVRMVGSRVTCLYVYTCACVMRGARQVPLDLLLLVYNVYSQWNYYYYY